MTTGAQTRPDRRRILLRIALPANGRPPAPTTAKFIADDGKRWQASLMSIALQVDPRIQGPIFFYTAPAANVLSGSILPVQLTVGEPGPGVAIPASAVMSWQRACWYYAEGVAGHFTRRQLAAGEPVAGGCFLRGLAPLAVVIRGAQALRR